MSKQPDIWVLMADYIEARIRAEELAAVPVQVECRAAHAPAVCAACGAAV